MSLALRVYRSRLTCLDPAARGRDPWVSADFLSPPGSTQCCPVNLSFIIGLYGVPAPWSMRSWEFVRRSAKRRHGLSRSHGPAEGGVDRREGQPSVTVSMPDRSGVAAALAFGAITTTLDPTALGLPRGDKRAMVGQDLASLLQVAAAPARVRSGARSDSGSSGQSARMSFGSACLTFST